MLAARLFPNDARLAARDARTAIANDEYDVAAGALAFYAAARRSGAEGPARLVLLAVLLVGALTLQFFIGSEEGVAGFQPVELVKTVLVVLLAFVGLHIAEARDREVRAYRRSPLKFLWPYLRTVGLFFLLVAAMVVGVRDFSPLIIMAFVMVAWFWRVGAWQGDFTGAKLIWWSIRPLILLAIVAVAVAGYYVYQDPTLLPESFPKKERIVVWAEPRQHPHTGSQVLGSMDLVGEAGWWGARAWWGANGKVMTLPAVQNDFITAFYINRFGGLAGLVLLVVEMLFVTVLFLLARGVEDSFGRGDFREQNPALVLGAIMGAAASKSIDKLTLIASPGIYDLGAWLEQLIAESTDTFFGDYPQINRRLPALRVSRFAKKLGRSAVVLGYEARAENLARSNDEVLDYWGRVDLAPELSRTFATSYLQLTPRLRPRYTWYSGSLDEVGLTTLGARSRPFFEGNLELRGPQLSRVFSGPGFYSDRIKHVIGPEVTWTYRTRVDDFDRIPKFDGNDQLLGTHQIDYALEFGERIVGLSGGAIRKM